MRHNLVVNLLIKLMVAVNHVIMKQVVEDFYTKFLRDIVEKNCAKINLTLDSKTKLDPDNTILNKLLNYIK